MKSKTDRHALVTGGAGFVGSNLAAHLLEHTSAKVTVFDNLARPGVEENLKWLQSLSAPGQLQIVRGDVRDRALLTEAARDATEIYHFAAQVAVTSSIVDPVQDCHVNILGTLHVLEAARAARNRPLVLFTSTNKVYGSLETIPVERLGDHYAFTAPGYLGVAETHPLDFHSPYGCSKGAADQYVRDYSRIYDVPTIVLRMSCIAGPRQLGTEDQGWIAHFLYSALEGEPITVYGDGCQVRDILHVHDLVEAIERLVASRATSAGHIYNVGGGHTQAVSVQQALRKIERLTGVALDVAHAEARPGDQQIYISDTTKLVAHTGWQPRRNLQTTFTDIATFWTRHLQGRRARTIAEPEAVTTQQGYVA